MTRQTIDDYQRVHQASLEAFGTILRQQRQEIGKSQSEIASEIGEGFDQSRISAIENGDSRRMPKSRFSAEFLLDCYCIGESSPERAEFLQLLFGTVILPSHLDYIQVHLDTIKTLNQEKNFQLALQLAQDLKNFVIPISTLSDPFLHKQRTLEGILAVIDGQIERAHKGLDKISGSLSDNARGIK